MEKDTIVKISQFTVPQKTQRYTHKTLKSPFPQLETAKKLVQSKISEKTKNWEKGSNFSSKNVSGKSNSAENPEGTLRGFLTFFVAKNE